MAAGRVPRHPSGWRWSTGTTCTRPERPLTPTSPKPRAPGGLLRRAASNSGDFFLRNTNPAGPQEWTVTVASRSSVRWHCTGGAIQFLADLADLVTGAVEPWALPSVGTDVVTW
ncbi:hypothetical protein GCM10009663_38210 [Kitasatospora arboriphila]|uniref:DUF317 domain-containing protein n=1 Tax=Kitasatospora arboriphila TaxID=258052 RepID=A0ABN1TJS1_9ACTN